MPQGIIEALRQDHDELRQMFTQLETATGEQRRDLFHQLLGELIRHEVSEEEILRPVSKRDAGEEIANARIKEESQAEELLKEMENLDTDSAEFTAKLATLRQEVENLAEAEAAKKAAPTRPHPSTRTPPSPTPGQEARAAKRQHHRWGPVDGNEGSGVPAVAHLARSQGLSGNDCRSSRWSGCWVIGLATHNRSDRAICPPANQYCRSQSRLTDGSYPAGSGRGNSGG